MTEPVIMCFTLTCFLVKADAKALVNTQVNYDSDEFNTYAIDKEAEITFSLKEFKVKDPICNYLTLSLS